MKSNYLESRHIGLSEKDEQKMLEVIGADSLEQLIHETMPEDILLPKPIELDAPMSEQELLDYTQALADENVPVHSLFLC